MRGALLAAILLLVGCGEPDTIVIEDETPDVIHTTEHVYHETTVELYHTTVVVEEDTTPDVIETTEYVYPSGPVPCLIIEEEGVPAMADGPVSGLPDEATTVGDQDWHLLTQSGTSKKLRHYNFPLPTAYIGGLILSNDSGDPDNDVNITAGSCRGAADDANLRLASEITKQIDAAWSAGDDAGGMDTGVVAASTLYAVWLIKNPTTDVVDALFSLNFSAPTMPSGYTKKRLIGAVKTDSSTDIIQFLHSGDEFVYVGDSGTRPPEDINDSTITHQTWETGTLSSVPPLCMANINAFVSNPTTTGTDGSIWIRTPSAWSGFNPYWCRVQTASAYDAVAGMGRVLVDASQQIEYRVNESDGAATFYATVFGFTMLTRRNPQ
jgi:hypothetical protein